MKHLRKLLIALLGGIIIMSTLVACQSKKSVEQELEPLFEILDKQTVELENVVLIRDSFDVYNTHKRIFSFQFDLNHKSNEALLGNFVKDSSEETINEKVSFANNELIFEIVNSQAENLLFQEFHFSSDYFNDLLLEAKTDSFERYEKVIRYQEKKLSSYSQQLITDYSLSENSEVTITVEKLRGEDTNFRYILTYYLHDKVNSMELRRILVIKIEEQ